MVVYYCHIRSYDSPPLKTGQFEDDWNWEMKVDFTDKLGGAFATAGGQVGGQEHVVVCLLLFMLHNRMVVAGPLYRNEKTGSIRGESGAAAITGPLDPGVGEGEVDGARRLGERLANQASVKQRNVPCRCQEGGIKRSIKCT